MAKRVEVVATCQDCGKVFSGKMSARMCKDHAGLGPSIVLYVWEGETTPHPFGYFPLAAFPQIAQIISIDRIPSARGNPNNN